MAFKLLSDCSNHDKFIRARLRSPHFAGSAQNLTDLRGGAGQFKNGKRFQVRIEAHESIRAKVAQPDPILIVHINRVGLRAVTRQFPLAPSIVAGVVHRYLARIPLTDPNPSLRIGPDAPRALTRSWRLKNGCFASLWINTTDIAVCQ